MKDARKTIGADYSLVVKFSCGTSGFYNFVSANTLHKLKGYLDKFMESRRLLNVNTLSADQEVTGLQTGKARKIIPGRFLCLLILLLCFSLGICF